MGNSAKLDRLRQGYEAFDRGDLDALREFLAPDIVWHSGGDNALTGDYKGIDEVFGLFGKLFEVTDGTFKQEVHELLAGDEHSVAITHSTAQRSDGRTLDIDQVAIFHSDDQNRISEAWLLPQDQKAADAFFA